MENKYENFTLSLALVDMLPVVFFSASVIIIGINFKNIFFIIGAVLTALAGLVKVIWKTIVAATGKDIPILNKQMRFVMPAGFILMVVGVINGKSSISLSHIFECMTSVPAIIFYIIGVLGMVTMMVLAFKLDSTKAKSNWIEQITNSIAQGAILLGIIFSYI